jgi:hypothetical protein
MGAALRSTYEREGMKEHTQPKSYEPPRVQILGPVHVLTQSGLPAKQYGGADGAMFNQQSVSWAS